MTKRVFVSSPTIFEGTSGQTNVVHSFIRIYIYIYIYIYITTIYRNLNTTYFFLNQTKTSTKTPSRLANLLSFHFPFSFPEFRKFPQLPTTFSHLFPQVPRQFSRNFPASLFNFSRNFPASLFNFSRNFPTTFPQVSQKSCGKFREAPFSCGTSHMVGRHFSKS